MKYKVMFEEVLVHEFEVEAASFDAVSEEFEYLAGEGKLDFSDGEVIDSGITKVFCEDTGAREKFNPSHADLLKERIEIDLKDGYKLVAERNSDRPYREIFLFLEDDNGVIHQDLAIVGEHYEYDETGEVSPISGVYSVKVYSDELQEDFQHDYMINRYEEESL